eukprot:gene12871-15726_t
MGEYITPLMVGGPDSMMIGNLVQSMFGPMNNWPAGAALAVVMMLTIALAGLVFVVLNKLVQRFPLEGFTLYWYWDLFQRGPLLQALWNSVKVATFVSVLSTLIAIPAALAIARYRMPGKAPAVSFIMLPLVLPGLIMGVALLTVLNRLGVQLSLVTVTIGHMVICLPY